MTRLPRQRWEGTRYWGHGWIVVSRRRSSLLVLVLLAVVINLPLLHSTWTQWRVERSGVHVTGAVTDHRTVGTGDGAQHLVWFTLPEEVDADQQVRRAEVERTTYDDAVESARVGVRVLEDDPSAFQVDGAVESHATLVATLVADAFLLVVLLLLWRLRGMTRPQLEAVAMEDVRQGPPGGLLERVDGELYLIGGEVATIGDELVVLDVGGRSVLVRLAGHHNPVGHQQPAQVRARMIG